LPQWRQEFATYFVTFRLADSLPLDLLQRWKEEKTSWLESNPEPWSPVQRRFFNSNFPGRMERWLDRGMGECILENQSNRECLEVSLTKGDAIDYFLGDWVIMPNHVHLLVRPLRDVKLSKLLQVWKGASSHRINRRSGGGGRLWMEESFTRIVRNRDKLKKASEYIRNNPGKASLVEGTYSLACGKAKWLDPT